MSDALSDEEQIEKIKTWWDENGTGLLIGIVIVVGSVIGWRWFDASRGESTERAALLFDTFVRAEGEARADIARQIDDEIPGTSYQTLSLFYRARAAHDEGDLESSEGLLRRALDAAPEDVLRDLARLRIARVLQQDDRSDEALAVLGTIASQGYRAHALELKGDIHMARSERTLAHEAYREALETLEDDGARPLLEMKVHDTADAAGA